MVKNYHKSLKCNNEIVANGKRKLFRQDNICKHPVTLSNSLSDDLTF